MINVTLRKDSQRNDWGMIAMFGDQRVFVCLDEACWTMDDEPIEDEPGSDANFRARVHELVRQETGRDLTTTEFQSIEFALDWLHTHNDGLDCATGEYAVVTTEKGA